MAVSESKKEAEKIRGIPAHAGQYHKTNVDGSWHRPAAPNSGGASPQNRPENSARKSCVHKREIVRHNMNIYVIWTDTDTACTTRAIGIMHERVGGWEKGSDRNWERERESLGYNTHYCFTLFPPCLINKPIREIHHRAVTSTGGETTPTQGRQHKGTPYKKGRYTRRNFLPYKGHGTRRYLTKGTTTMRRVEPH